MLHLHVKGRFSWPRLRLELTKVHTALFVLLQYITPDKMFLIVYVPLFKNSLLIRKQLLPCTSDPSQIGSFSKKFHISTNIIPAINTEGVIRLLITGNCAGVWWIRTRRVNTTTTLKADKVEPTRWVRFFEIDCGWRKKNWIVASYFGRLLMKINLIHFQKIVIVLIIVLLSYVSRLENMFALMVSYYRVKLVLFWVIKPALQ